MTLPFLSQKELQERQVDGWPAINSEASCMCRIIMNFFLFQLCRDPVTAPCIVLSIGLSSTRPDCTWTRFSRGALSCNVCAMSYIDWRWFTLHSHFIVVLHTHECPSASFCPSVCLCVCDWQWTIINVSRMLSLILVIVTMTSSRRLRPPSRDQPLYTHRHTLTWLGSKDRMAHSIMDKRVGGR